MKRRDDISLDEIRAARPQLRPTGDEWVESERGRRVLQRVIESDRSASPGHSAQQRRSGWGMGPRLAFAAGAAIVVMLAVVLTVLVLFQDEGKERRVASTVTSAPAAQQVSINEAVAGVMPMYKNLKGYDSAPLTNGATLAGQAAGMGLIPREAVSGDAGSGPMTQGEYAMFLVQAFGSFLAPLSPSPSADPGAVGDELGAIDFLRAAGIILPEDGDFDAAQPLTKPVEDRLVARLQLALDYQTD